MISFFLELTLRCKQWIHQIYKHYNTTHKHIISFLAKKNSNKQIRIIIMTIGLGARTYHRILHL